MSKNTSILLGEHYLNVVAKAVDSGRYSSASEVVREGLRLFEKKYATQLLNTAPKAKKTAEKQKV
jgi:antitoxin ParD1/3/4